MIFASSKGSDIAGALRYVEGPGRDQVEGRATLLGGGGFGFEPSDDRTAKIAKQLMVQNGSREFQGQKDRYCEKDCLHFSLSWHPDQAPPDLEEKRETARKFLKALGMENSMHLVYDHADKKHPHIHIVASRIDPETRMAYDDYWRVKKGIQCALEKEREDELKGLRPIPEAKRQLHTQLGQEREVDPERRLEAIQKLYAARKEEQSQRYRAKRAIDGLYKVHEREKERQMTQDDGVGGRWAKEVKVPEAPKVNEKDFGWVKDLADRWRSSFNEHAAKEVRKEREPKEAVKERESKDMDRVTVRERKEPKMAKTQKELDKALATIMKPGFGETWQKNREAAKIEPKRSVVDRITERAPKMEKTREIEREREL